MVSWTAEYDQRREDTGALEILAQETGGKTCEDARELLGFKDTAARKRTDLTPLLAGLALLMFLFDVAQRRLELFRENDKTEMAETAVKPVREKKPKQSAKKPEAEAPAAADVLWQNMQKKKRL